MAFTHPVTSMYLNCLINHNLRALCCIKFSHSCFFCNSLSTTIFYPSSPVNEKSASINIYTHIC